MRNLGAKNLRPGPILNPAVEKIGEHCGLPLATIGERLRLPGLPAPLFIRGFDFKKNAILAASDSDLFADEFEIQKVGWIAGVAPSNSIKISAQIRLHHPTVPCSIYPGKKRGELRVHLTQKVRAVTPGQVCAFYTGDRLLGGGVILEN